MNDRLRPQPGPIERRIHAELLEQWRSAAGIADRLETAAMYRRAGAALLRAADLYETADTPGPIAEVVVPVVGALVEIVRGYAVGTVIRQSARRRDAGGN